VDLVPERLRRRKFGSAGNRIQDLWVSSQELCAQDRKGGQDLHITIQIRGIIHRPVFYLKHSLSETGFCLRLQVEPTQVGPIEGAPATTPIGISGFLDFVHRPEFEIIENITFRRTGLFPLSVQREGDTYSVGSLRKN
jgi:hypothetical protein